AVPAALRGARGNGPHAVAVERLRLPARLDGGVVFADVGRVSGRQDGMMFLNPWAIAIGVVAAGLPIAVHFLTRPKPVRLPLSTLRFVHEAVEQRQARHRLRDAIVLALRTLAVLFVGFAVARPFLGQSDVAAVD